MKNAHTLTPHLHRSNPKNEGNYVFLFFFSRGKSDPMWTMTNTFSACRRCTFCIYISHNVDSAIYAFYLLLVHEENGRITRLLQGFDGTSFIPHSAPLGSGFSDFFTLVCAICSATGNIVVCNIRPVVYTCANTPDDFFPRTTLRTQYARTIKSVFYNIIFCVFVACTYEIRVLESTWRTAGRTDDQRNTTNVSTANCGGVSLWTTVYANYRRKGSSARYTCEQWSASACEALNEACRDK